MSESVKIKTDYKEAVRQILSEDSNSWVEFEGRWQKNDYRSAYLFMEKLIQIRGLRVPESFRKADEDFYWEFVN